MIRITVTRRSKRLLKVVDRLLDEGCRRKIVRCLTRCSETGLHLLHHIPSMPLRDLSLGGAAELDDQHRAKAVVDDASPQIGPGGPRSRGRCRRTQRLAVSVLSRHHPAPAAFRSPTDVPPTIVGAAGRLRTSDVILHHLIDGGRRSS